MSWSDFALLLICCGATMLACRILPLFLLKGKKLPESINEALGYIPPAVFAALVANDLFAPDMFNAGVIQAVIPLIASVFVVIVAMKTKSLLWSAVVGVVAYGLLAVVLT